MRVKVLYFAAVQELVGTDTEVMDLPPEVATVRSFAQWIEAERPALAGRMRAVRVARNESFARAEDPLVEGDVLALIPPVAGG